MKDRTENILEQFQALNNIPRGSGNIKPVFNYLTQWAKAHGFKYISDELFNISIEVPASPGYEDSPGVILQGHMDMVCEKTPGSKHDFLRDPIDNYVDGDWLRAKETSLGADNGIALAISFDLLLNPEIKHPPLEILITTEEEVGMDGAKGLSEDFLKGRILFNLDSEDEGVLTIGCAGGCDSYFDFPRSLEALQGEKAYEIIIDGLQGGHSGVDIHLGKGSAMEMMGRMILQVAKEKNGRIISMNSGSGATNAIARRAEFTMAFPDDMDVQFWIKQWQDILQQENHVMEKALTLSICPKEITPAALGIFDTIKLGSFICSLPQGVVNMSRDMQGLVETSSNIAGVRTTQDNFEFFGSQRSSVMSRLYWVRDRIVALAELAGCRNIRVKNKYPAWQPDMESPLLKKCSEEYKKLFGKEPIIEAIHAGLEPGLIAAKYPGMLMISIGPTLTNPHSPDEALYIPSLKPFYEFLAALLENFKIVNDQRK
ncbi:MAG: aminoacyl-histidine dipeptidase [Spirochaetaceae bacterium]|jgi:dipeptidase D|nr:aminoacyl-histidine dipeptidase [Spirochaetaceae bacterium]